MLTTPVPHEPRPPLPTLPEWVEHCGDDYPRGNVVRTSTGVTPITQAAADKLPRGKRGQRKGLLYDERWKGFEPRRWRIVVSEKERVRRLLLAPEVAGEPPTVVDVVRSPMTTDWRLLGITEYMVDVHGLVREDDDAFGGMVGIGDRLDYNGQLSKFKVPDEKVRSRVQRGLEVAARAFAMHFERRGVGYEEMLEKQAELWPRGTPDVPQCYDASSGLGNSMHSDRDGARSFAVWLCKLPGASSSWWLLFPRHSVAIALTVGRARIEQARP
jgi:hypothetical protein